MKQCRRFPAFLFAAIFLIVFVSCTLRQHKSIALSSFTENDVTVSISLRQEPKGDYVLSATFTPPRGYHLYSKDIPAEGVNGLGRPTLLALTSKSHLMAAGSLTESVKSQAADFEPRELLIYPEGPVTMQLPVRLPEGDQWVQDELSITYMACSANQCKPPVEAKLVPVKVPGRDVVHIQ